MKIFEWIADQWGKITSEITAFGQTFTGVQREIDNKHIALVAIRRTVSVDHLDRLYKTIPSELTDLNEISVAYTLRREELEGQNAKTIADVSLGMFGTGIKKGVDAVTQAALANLKPLFEDMQKTKPEDMTSDKVNDLLDKAAASGEFGLNAVVAFMLGHFLSPILSTTTAPIWEGMGQQVWKAAPVRLLDEGSLIRLTYRYPNDKAIFHEELRLRGYSKDRIKELLKAYLYYPSPAELTHWQAKEVFEPDMIKKYGLADEMEGLEKEQFYKAGMDDIQIENFWKAHWEHPAFRQVIDMRRRGLIEDKDIWDWFKLVEIPPYWRDKLIELSHSFLTRVDLRRIWVMGDKDEDWLRKRMHNLGYFDEEEDEMVEFYKKYKLQHQKDLTESRILKGLRKGAIDKSKCAEYLIALGYSVDEAEFIIESELYDKNADEKEEDIMLLVNDFVAGVKDKEQLISGLGAFHLTEREIRQWVSYANKERRKLRKFPPEAKLTEWYKAKVIDEAEYRKRLLGLNYDSEDVERYIGKKK